MWKVDVISILWMCLLMWLSVEDIRHRTIPRWFLFVGTSLIAASMVTQQETGWMLRVGGVCIGGIFLLLSRVTREAMGYGDSLLVCLLGGAVGLWTLLEILAISWGLLGLVAIVCLVKKSCSRRKSLPMIPFLTVGYGTVLVMQCIR